MVVLVNAEVYGNHQDLQLLVIGNESKERVVV